MLLKETQGTLGQKAAEIQHRHPIKCRGHLSRPALSAASFSSRLSNQFNESLGWLIWFKSGSLPKLSLLPLSPSPSPYEVRLPVQISP